VIKTLQKLQLYLPLILVTLLFSLFYLVFINLFNSDLGRHIANGREISLSFTDGSTLIGSDFNHSENFKKILTTNYYSYTQNNFKTINHHWFFGVIVYALHELGGFKLLTWFNLILNTLAFGFILLTAVEKMSHVKENRVGNSKQLNILLITVISFLVMPLITSRTEVRPESFSLLFLSIYYYLFSKFNFDFNKKLISSKKLLFILLLLLQILWVNTHLFFIFGPLLAGFFLFHESLKSFLNKLSIKDIYDNKKIKFWLNLSSSLFLVSLINPNGLNGLLEPFNIFNNYAYKVAENQSTFFLINYGSQTELNYYIVITSFIVLALGLISLFNKKILLEKRISELLMLSIFTILANKISRMAPFLVIFMIPYLSNFVINFFNKLSKNKTELHNNILIMIFTGFVFFTIILSISFRIFIPNFSNLKSGELPNSYLAVDFYINNNLKGPIFNNYDVGGYLAYNLFPEEKLFIDNRPEAYSEDFLKNEFLAALKNEAVWERTSAKYNPNVIFFFRHDQVDGAQEFLFNRVDDENWIPVFVDGYILIFVKNVEENKDLINNFEIPKEIFRLNSQTQ
jgi:hypothetical protein